MESSTSHYERSERTYTTRHSSAKKDVITFRPELGGTGYESTLIPNCLIVAACSSWPLAVLTYKLSDRGYILKLPSWL
jgi:hypothetical protein